MRWSLLIVFSTISLCVSTTLTRMWDDLAEKHRWVHVPQGWQLQGPAPPNHTMHLYLSLKPQSMEGLVQSLYEVSDPSHIRYGVHLSQDEVNSFVAPSPDTLEIVDSWLNHHQVEPVSKSANGDFITLVVTVEQAENMLGTKYNVYSHAVTSESIIRTMNYSLPRELHDHIDLVSPTTYFGTTRSIRAMDFNSEEVHRGGTDVLQQLDTRSPSASDTPNCTVVTPSCLRALYKTETYKAQTPATNRLGIVGYVGEYANYADLQTFFQTYRKEAVGSNFTTVLVNGGLDDQSKPGSEANLDIQYTTAMSFPTPNIYYSTGGSPPFMPDSNTPKNTNEPYLDFLHFILSEDTVPQTLSTSYGDDEQTVPPDYAKVVCNLFAQLGSRGASILFSSGDSGVGGPRCKTNDGLNRTTFQPHFPASCPFVTTVGATYFDNTYGVEVGASLSGGGFSNYFPMPQYQKAAVSTFTNNLGPKYDKLFNKTGRAYPDVSAQGVNFRTIVGGQLRRADGTSASTPVFAGVISLLNDVRIANRQAPLGFLNPFLYTKGAAALNDIASGSNPGCDTDGFSALGGWDPVTGLGTPDFERLRAAVKNL